MDSTTSAETDDVAAASATVTFLAFHLFPGLPAELRRQIWAHVCAETRIIRVARKHDFHLVWLRPEKRCADAKLKAVHGPVPSLLHVNREARLVGLRNYQVVDFSENVVVDPKHTSAGTSRLYVNFTHDAFFCPSGDSLSSLLLSLASQNAGDQTAPCLSNIRRLIVAPDIFQTAVQLWQRARSAGSRSVNVLATEQSSNTEPVGEDEIDAAIQEEQLRRYQSRRQHIRLSLQDLTVLKWDARSSFGKMTKSAWDANSQGNEHETAIRIAALRQEVQNCYQIMMLMFFDVEVKDDAWMGNMRVLDGLKVNYQSLRSGHDLPLDSSWMKDYADLKA